MEVRPHGTTVQVSNGLTERVCEFRVEVSLDNGPRYEATCKQHVPEIYIPQLSTPNAVVAVRANADQLDEIVLDLEHEAPTVTIAHDKNATSATEILATGQPAQAVIVTFGPIGMKTPEGVEVQAFKLTVMPVDGTPYQVDVGNATPPEALPLLFSPDRKSRSSSAPKPTKWSSTGTPRSTPRSAVAKPRRPEGEAVFVALCKVYEIRIRSQRRHRRRPPLPSGRSRRDRRRWCAALDLRTTIAAASGTSSPTEGGSTPSTSTTAPPEAGPSAHMPRFTRRGTSRRPRLPPGGHRR